MDYSLFGQSPDVVLAPSTVDELAASLRAASAERAAVVPWGAGARQHIGAPPARYTIALSTAALDQVVEYNPADLVVTVQAGVTLGALQARLAEHGQRLPWDPPAPPEATIGGLLATNASGPSRLGFGPPRDWTLGMQVVLGDGRPVRSGGKVVKNVAGYDAHKLHIGALGTLGVIVEATFKVAPLPVKSVTVLARSRSIDEALRNVEALRQPPLEPVSLLLVSEAAGWLLTDGTGSEGSHSAVVIARFEGTAAALGRLSSLAAQRLEGHATMIEGGEEARHWDAFRSFCSEQRDETVLLRAGARPGALSSLAAALRAPAAHFVCYGGVGLGYAWLDARREQPEQVRAELAGLRAALAQFGGYVVVEDAPPALRPALDIWGPPPPNLPLMRALKAQWDPHTLLNPGRYAGGL